MKGWARHMKLFVFQGKAVFPSKKLDCLELCNVWNPVLLAGANGSPFSILSLQPTKTPTPIAKPNLGHFSSCISIKRMYSLWWDYENFLWRKKELKFKSICNSGSHKLKRGRRKISYHSRVQDLQQCLWSNLILSSVCTWMNLITPLRGLAFLSSTQVTACQIRRPSSGYDAKVHSNSQWDTYYLILSKDS